MPPPPTPLALPLPSALHFLRYVISNTPPAWDPSPDLEFHTTTTKTLLVICSSRNAFLHTLLDSSSGHLNSHLTTPLSTLAASVHIKIVFTPTIQHLRAYLSSLPSRDSSGSQPVLLAIWGLVEAHAETTEYSAQGIGRTVASVVAAGVRTGMGIVVGGVKCGGAEGFDGGEGMHVQVPMLNSTVKLGKEMEVVARGRVNVRDIFLRWFIWKEYEDEEGEAQYGEQEERGGAAARGRGTASAPP
ncbi:hypothetical protein L211DRAFT_834971 [Terfezia boudieri ATCC MYA-4762]|uniref:Uncharacterized protein n=1 Tax=Terfezia boudieri ATCC MYA-4762 TaxID=1051890 RepID=A0A3N4LUQ0_9PEZI|nr:hypothetical protein L211DRAFT_834971 [Terfezia boudieri ATCC MYA-4762]